MNKDSQAIKLANWLFICLIASLVISCLYFFIVYGELNAEALYLPMVAALYAIHFAPWLVGAQFCLVLARRFSESKKRMANTLASLSSLISVSGIMYVLHLSIQEIEKR